MDHPLQLLKITYPICGDNSARDILAADRSQELLYFNWSNCVRFADQTVGDVTDGQEGSDVAVEAVHQKKWDGCEWKQHSVRKHEDIRER
jgi:hypothetical protein